MPFQGTELLEVIEFPVQDVRLSGVLGDEERQCVPQRLWRLEPGDEAARLQHRAFAPAPEELDCHLSLTASPGFTGLPGGEDHGTDRAEQSDGVDRGRDRRDLLGPIGHRASLTGAVAEREPFMT